MHATIRHPASHRNRGSGAPPPRGAGEVVLEGARCRVVEGNVVEGPVLLEVRQDRVDALGLGPEQDRVIEDQERDQADRPPLGAGDERLAAGPGGSPFDRVGREVMEHRGAVGPPDEDPRHASNDRRGPGSGPGQWRRGSGRRSFGSSKGRRSTPPTKRGQAPRGLGASPRFVGGDQSSSSRTRPRVRSALSTISREGAAAASRWASAGEARGIMPRSSTISASRPLSR